MDLDAKIGQLFVVVANHDDVIHHVRDNRVGGVIWFATTTQHAAETNARLQSIAETPLLISADLESGMGMRFTDATWWPPAMALAATGDPDLAEEQSRITALEARAIGVDHILAPVADVNVNPANPVINTRSFGEDPQAVARFVAASVRGTQDGGCLATAKHFPGHGDTRVDSHRALPLLDVTRERLDAVELLPFRAAIDAGVASVMMGHLGVPVLDDTPAPVRTEFENVYGTSFDEVTRGGTLPATVSSAMISLLRDLGFEGLVITDSFDMGGLAAHFDPGEAAVRAIEAGEDQILYSADTGAAIAAVRAAVRSGRLSESRIDQSVERIMSAKRAAGGPPAHGRRPSSDLAEDIARRSITLVRDTRGLLPLRARNVAVRTFCDEPLLELPGDSGNPGTADILLLLLAARPKSGAGKIAVPEDARRLAEGHAEKTIAISFGSPYVLRELGEVSTFVCAWGIQPVLQRAAMRAVRGEADMPGKLPVTI